MAKETFIEVGGREVRVSNPDKVFFPQHGYTKLDLANYFLAVGEAAQWRLQRGEADDCRTRSRAIVS